VRCGRSPFLVLLHRLLVLCFYFDSLMFASSRRCGLCVRQNELLGVRATSLRASVIIVCFDFHSSSSSVLFGVLSLRGSLVCASGQCIRALAVLFSVGVSWVQVYGFLLPRSLGFLSWSGVGRAWCACLCASDRGDVLLDHTNNDRTSFWVPLLFPSLRLALFRLVWLGVVYGVRQDIQEMRGLCVCSSAEGFCWCLFSSSSCLFPFSSGLRLAPWLSLVRQE
jgi:hypothetical protein